MFEEKHKKCIAMTDFTTVIMIPLKVHYKECAFLSLHALTGHVAKRWLSVQSVQDRVTTSWDPSPSIYFLPPGYFVTVLAQEEECEKALVAEHFQYKGCPISLQSWHQGFQELPFLW